MELVALVTGIILLEYMVFGIMVGIVRGKVGIDAPAMTGDPQLERMLRVQLNTLEQMVVVIPAMWIYAQTLSVTVAAGLGMVFVIGRLLYCKAYLQDPKNRAVGFSVGMLATFVLILGGLYGSASALL